MSRRRTEAGERRVACRLRVAAEDVDAVELPCRTSRCSSGRAPRWPGTSADARSFVSHCTCGGAIGNDWSEHCCTSAVDTNGMSGRPVTAPVESLQLRMLSTDGQRTPPRCPPSATSFSHALISAFLVSFGVELRVVEVDHDLAAGEAAAAGLAVDVLRRRLRPRRPTPLNRFGANGLSTSAITAMWISLSVIPTSVAFGFSSPDCATAVVLTPAIPMTIAAHNAAPNRRFILDAPVSPRI